MQHIYIQWHPVIVVLEEGLRNLMKHDRAQYLIDAVDYKEFPEYLNLVAYPMYLSLIYERLTNGFYRRIEV